MTALLRAELLKLRSTRTFVSLAGAAVTVSLLLVALSASTQDYIHHPVDLHSLFTADFTSLFLLLLRAIGMTGERRHRTITGSILAALDRGRLLAAKALAYTLAGLVLSVVTTLAIMLTGTLILSHRGQPTLDITGLADLMWRNVAVAALLAPLGGAIDALLRNQIATVVGSFLVGRAGRARARPSGSRTAASGPRHARTFSPPTRTRAARVQKAAARRSPPGCQVGQDCRKASKSALIVSAWVVGMPCGNPL